MQLKVATILLPMLRHKLHDLLSHKVQTVVQGERTIVTSTTKSVQGARDTWRMRGKGGGCTWWESPAMPQHGGTEGE